MRYVYEEPALCNTECSFLPSELRETLEIAHSSPTTFRIEEALAQMPAAWVAQLHSAVLCTRENEIWQLIAQLHPNMLLLLKHSRKKLMISISIKYLT